MKRSFTSQSTQPALGETVTIKRTKTRKGSGRSHVQRRGETFGLPKVLKQPRIGFPKQMVMKHSYFESIPVSATTGVLTFNLWRCNGMFDPYQTGGGHQPQYFDIMCQIYDHWVVTAAKITAKCVQNAASAVSGASTFGLYINDDNSNVSTVAACCEQNSAVFATALANSNNQAIVTKKWNVEDAFGETNPLANTNLQGTASADPTEQQTFAVFFAPYAANTTTCQIEVYIEYTAVWFELKDLEVN